MAKQTTKSGNQRANGKDGQTPTNEQTANRLTDDTHDFVLTDNSVDFGNENLANGHEAFLADGVIGAEALFTPQAFDEQRLDSITKPNGTPENSPGVTPDTSPNNTGNGSTGEFASVEDAGSSSERSFTPAATDPYNADEAGPTAATASTDGSTQGGSGGGSAPEENNAPIELDLFGTITDEDTSKVITQDMLLATYEDADGDVLTAADVTVSGGKIIDNGDGTWTFTPDSDFNGDVDIAFTVSDGEVTIPGSGIVRVAAVNDGPVADDVDLGATQEDTSFIITEAALLANASDIDGDELTVTDVSVDAEYGSLTDNGDGTWTFAPTTDLNADDVPFAFTVSDGTTTDGATAVLDITEVNDGPVADDVDLGATAEDTSFIITEAALLANASDIDGDELTVTDVSVDAEYGTLTDNGDGTWTFAPTTDLNADDVPFAFTVSDGTTTDDATAVLDITEVNDGPVADDVDLGATQEDTSFIITEAALLANASDIDGDELTVTDVSADAEYGSLTDNGDGTWTFAPTTDLNADNVPFAFTVSDGTTTDDATAVLDITEVNDGPVADDVDLGATQEDTSFIITEAALLANASDIDGDELSVTDVSVSAEYGSLTDNGDGTWTFAPTTDLNADDVPFAFTVSDGTTTDGATAVLDITEVNDGPVADDVDLGATAEDTSFIITEAALLANASDIDGDELSVTDVSVSAEYGSLTDNGDGTWTFAPTTDLNAVDVPFAFTVFDGTTTDGATAVLDITEVNDGPVADDVDLGATAEDTSFIITEAALLANASDIDGDELTVTDVSVDAEYGSLTDNGDGTWTFAPTADLNADDVPFAFTVYDGTTTDGATAVLDITEVNDGPVADDVDLGATAEDTSFIITEAALLANASDIDGDELTVTDVSVDAEYGSLTDNGDGTWTFAPTADLNADDVPFAFTVSDGTTTDDATAVLDITEVNDGPVADDVDLGATQEDTSFIITEAALLANASDIDGDELTVTDVSVDAEYGSLTDNGDGTWTFAPTADLNADDVPFAFTVSDGTTTDDATAVLDITEVNDGPVADDVDLGATAEDTSFIITEAALLANASDIDGDELTVTDVSVDAEYGTLTDNGDGTWTFAPTTDLNADDVPFAFTVSDGTTTDDATAVLDITEVNDGPVADDVDLGATQEDTSFIITEAALLANASDIDGDELSVTDVSVDAEYGSLTDNGDGTWTFAPTTDLNADDVPFAFTVSDGTTTDDATAVLDITEVNDGPVADDVDLGATAEDTSFIITEAALLANASDIDGDELTVTDVSVDAEYGTLTDNGDGTWTFAPTADLNADDVPFAFTVSDGTTTDDATAVLDITEVNDGPVADDVDLGATAEDTSFIITEAALLANASDIDGDELTVTDVSVDAEYGTLTDNGDGTWTFAPTADLNADDVPFAFTVSDGTTTDDATAVLDITEVNDGPVADDVDLGATAEDTSFIITEAALLANASDIDGDELTVTDVSVDAEYGSLTDNGDGTWTFAPTADLNADDVPFAFTVSDGTTTDGATAVLDITEVNDGPVADDVDLGATAEDTSFIITEAALLANASDIDGDELSVTDVSVSAEYGSLTDNGDGTWTFAPTTDLNAVDVPFAFTVFDGTTTDGATAVLDITEVNDGPVADDVDLGATAEDTSFIITEAALLANASDIDGDELTVTDVSVDAEYGSLTDNGDGTWTFAPTADLNADDVPFAFTVSDGTTTDDATAVLDITEVNDGPVADDVDLGATAEDTSFIITEAALLANASDIDGDELTVTDVSVDAEYGSLTDNGDGTWTFAPTADLNADDVPFAFTVSDGTTTDDATAVLDITEVNDGPVADDVDLGATQEDTSFIITEAALLANASDIDGDELTVTDVSVDAEYGSLTDNGDGTWTFAPTADLNADDVPFAFTVSDGTTTDDATAVLDITEVNDGPVADDVDLGATAEDTSFIITEAALLANASDIDGDELTVTDVSVDAEYGTLTDNGDGTWTFAPTTDLNADDVPFAFTVSDGTTTDDATAVLDITEVNDGPVADDVDLGATQEDTSFIITEAALLANASDIDGDELSVTDVSVDAEYGSLTDNGDGTWTFAPTTDLNADDVPFAFTVSDGTTTDDATAVLDITEVNDGPVADDVDLGATAEDTSFIITEAALLANASDIDGDELTVTDVSVDAEYGTLTDNGDGTWTFAPTADLNADDVPFAFTVSDGTTTDDATAVLDITEVNDGPVADDVDLGATAEDTSFIITEAALLANASDIDGDELTVTDVSVDAEYGTLTDNGDGTWTFAPTADLNADDVPFAFTVSDGTTTDDATAVLDITEVNDGPVADDVDLGATAEDTSFIITEAALLANASDIDGDELTVTDVSVDAEYGSLTDNGDGTWTFAPTADLNADDVPFAFTVSDGTTTDGATAVLDITEVNDGPVADDVDLGATAEDTSFIITEAALLANASDIDGDELSVTDVSVSAEYGSLTDNGDGTWTFAPTTDLNAVDVPFAFTVFDGTTTDGATAVLDITEVNDGPVADDVDLGATAEDTSFIITEAALLANASDIDGDELTVTDVSVDAEYGSLTDNGDGTWTFAPTADLNADDVPFAFTVSDGTTTDDATAVLDITEVNDGPVADDVDLGATAEDTSFIITEAALLANASDIDGDELTVTDVSVDAEYGSLTDNGDGTWTFAPTADLNADDVPFAFTVSDGTTTDDATAVLDITEVNDGPVADDVDLGATQEDTSFIITEAALLANASDIDGDELTVTDVSVDAEYGSLTDNGDGTWTFAPTADLNADDVPFAFTVSDGTTTDDATAVLDITEVNDGPVADDVDLGATAEDTSFIITEAALLANASDIDGDELTVTDVSVDAEYGTLTDNGDGTWTFAPTTDLNADDVPFAFTVSDGTTTDDATAVLDITEVNDGPVADDVDLGATQEDTSFIITEAALLANASDIDGDELSVTDVSVDAEYGSLTDNGDGTWTFAPTTDLNADDVPFAFTVSDGTTTDDATAVLDITEVNDGPVADDVDLGATAEDTSFIITEAALLANASDIDGDELTVTDVSVDAEYGTLTDNGDGTWTFAPTADLNADDVPFAFTVSDGTTTDDATAVLDITEVNDGPVADDVDLGATAEDTSFIITEAALLANASDIDGDELTVTDVSVDAEYGSLTDNGDGTWTFAPTADLNADDVPFAFTVSDGTTTDDATAVLDITEVNDGPVADDVDLGATQEDTSFIITEAALLANASDIDGDELTVTDVSVDAEYGSLTDNGDGTWTFAPTADLNADDVPFAFTVSDGTTTDDATAVLDITEVNDGPVADDVDLGATAEDTSFIITEAALLANASDIDGDELTVTDVSVDAEYGTLTDNGDGTWTFAPTTDLNADDVPFAFTVSDGTTTDDATAVLDITEVNDGPVADDVDLGATQEDTSFIITEAALLANASDIDGDELSVTDVSVDAEYGSLTDNGDGTWTFAPTTDLNADDVPFAFTVSDGTTTDDATAVLDITEVNDGPVADDVDLGATAEDTSFIITEAALLANASDIDGDELTVTDVSVDAEYGTLTDNGDGTWTFAPTADLNADDVPFAFTVSDGTTTDDATAVLDITEVNDAPTDIQFLTTQTITTSNYDTVSGVTVTARNINSDGSLTSESEDNVSYTNSGIGANGDSGDVASQIEYNTEHEVSEELIFDFDADQTSVTVDVDRLYGSEGNGGEEGTWTAYRDGVEVGSGIVDSEPGELTATLKVTATDGGGFDRIVFAASEFPGGQEGTSGSSDYYVSAITFQGEETLSIKENSTSGTVATLSATDVDDTEFSYEFVDGAGNVVTDSNFIIVGNEIQIRADADIDYEQNTVFNLNVRVTDDDGASYTETLTVDVVDVYEADMHFSADSFSSKPGKKDVVATASFDAHPGSSSHSFSLTDSESGLFTIDSSTGKISLTKDLPSGDYAATITVKAKDNNGRTYEEDITFTYDSGSGGTSISAGSGTDVIYGYGGEDTIDGGGGDDVIFGGDANDTIILSEGADTIDGGSGWDTLSVATDDDMVINLEAGTVSGGESNGTTLSSVEIIRAGDGDDVITGSNGTEALLGGGGNDTIDGGGGADYIYGEDGNDVLTGGTGNDYLSGGDGDDIFIYGAGDGSDTVDGGAGGGWTDAIELNGFDSNSYGTDWTVTITSGSIEGQNGDSLDLSDDAAGTINFDDGSQIDFDQLEQINW
ncbi:cadherin-like domain-containing protein [Pararhizobium sp. IMCC21322]|uniref:cadherin-like domain-containing protein n=1 Tax=Pararhizobium sp. IMCC21322 TaxID=3067903 RepID=UPI002740F649|nr:cadherin-like domain-containing protein [Pararhizobium sp. IMCC21322]